jgi:AraC family transcriptional regulator
MAALDRIRIRGVQSRHLGVPVIKHRILPSVDGIVRIPVPNPIAADAAHKYSVFPATFQQYKDGLPAAHLRSVIAYIHANLASNLGVSEIARVAFISPYHFGKLFKRSTGQTLHQYVLGQRIRKAQSLLMMTDLGLVEVASAVGLANQSHFTTVFKRRMGVTPGFYRTQVRYRSSSL